MIPNPIRKVLSSIQKHRVRALLMGGQACVFYGAAEFSRDTYLAILADAANLSRLRAALAELRAEVIAVPPLLLKYLRRGHAVHFRCRHPEAFRMRIDVMSVMRGVDSFNKLWARRTTITLPDGVSAELMSLPDLVKAKKILGGHMAIQGGVPPTILQAGSPQEVEELCKKLIKTVGKNGGFILGPGSAIDYAKPENIKAMVDTAKKYGRY